MGDLLLGLGVGPLTPPSVGNNKLLQEDGTSFILLEDDSGDILLET